MSKRTMLYYHKTGYSHYYVVEFVKRVRCPVSGQVMFRVKLPCGGETDIYQEQWGVHYDNPRFNPLTAEEVSDER